MEFSELVDCRVLMMALAAVFVLMASQLYNALFAKPRKLRRTLKEQGIGGPRQAILLGNIREISKGRMTTSSTGNPEAKPGTRPVHHDYAGALFPFLDRWRKQYGELFVFGLGNMQAMYVMRPEVVKDITTCTSLHLGRPSYLQSQFGPLFGQGIFASNGKVWEHQRKILAPELYMDKAMIMLINESASILVESWKIRVKEAGRVAEVKVEEYMRSFSGDVISKACFGSNYAEGKEIISKIRAIEEAMFKKTMSAVIPGMRYIPTKANREAWALEKEVKKLILQLVNERNKKDTTACEPDLLQTVLESTKNGDPISQKDADRFIVDSCKDIYLGGFESTAISAAWCLMLLAANPIWQDRVRSESQEIYSTHGLPDYDMLRKMKQLNMVIHEMLRLYPPVPIISREALKDMKFGDLKVPQGVNLWIPVVWLHTDPNIWGPDSYKFNPERFANGIAGACKLPYVYLPFGVGHRVCLGQNLAMIELKIVLSRLLCDFSFNLSPKYVHSPTYGIIIEPEFGIHLQIKKL